MLTADIDPYYRHSNFALFPCQLSVERLRQGTEHHFRAGIETVPVNVRNVDAACRREITLHRITGKRLQNQMALKQKKFCLPVDIDDLPLI